MATHISHACLPFPVKGARYTVWIGTLDASGTPTDLTSPDSERSLDGAAFADCTEEATVISGANGSAYLTLTGEETNCSLLAIAVKGTGPKTTLASLNPRVLPVLDTGTATAGGATSITLAPTAPAYDLRGCIIRTIGGTGGGGTGGRDNQARGITAYDPVTKVATVGTAWEVNAAIGTIYEILLTELACISLTANVTAISGDAAAADNLETMLDGTGGQVLSLKQLNIVNNAGSALVASSTGGNGHGIYATGHNAGAGIQGEGGATNSVGMGLVGYEHGLDTRSILNGHGIYALGGIGSGDGIHAEAQGDGDGMELVAAGGGLPLNPPAAAAVDAAEIADAVWDEAIAGHLSAGSTGEALDGAGTGGATAADIADAVWDENMSGHTTSGTAGEALITAGSQIDPWTYDLSNPTSSYDPGTAGRIMGVNLDAPVSSVGGGGATAAEIDAQLSSSHGSGSWVDTGGGGGGSGLGAGARPVPLRLVDQAAAGVPYQSVTLYDGSGDTVVAGPWVTAADGRITFNLDDGSYLIVVRATPQFEPLDPVPLTVAGVPAAEMEITLTAFSPGVPASAELCRVFGYLVLPSGAPAAGAGIGFQPSTSSFLTSLTSWVVASRRRVKVVAGEDGYFEADLIRSSQIGNGAGPPTDFRVVAPDCQLDALITVPDASSANLADLLEA